MLDLNRVGTSCSSGIHEIPEVGGTLAGSLDLQLRDPVRSIEMHGNA